MNFRIARHTNKIKKITAFYINILNLEILGSFTNHNNYDGVFIGKENLDWHLEFTTSDELAKHQFDDDDILVFYPTTMNLYNDIIENINTHKLKTHKAKNPYWHENGILIRDPDGYNIIVSNMKAE